MKGVFYLDFCIKKDKKVLPIQKIHSETKHKKEKEREISFREVLEVEIEKIKNT